MGFRDYNPGLNRFLTRDNYNGALADMGLGSDTFTGNRYAFVGGNPISRVEDDGHRPEDEPGYCVGSQGDCGIDPRAGGSVAGHYSNDQLSGMGVLEGQFISDTTHGADDPKTPNDNAPYKKQTREDYRVYAETINASSQALNATTGVVCATFNDLACDLFQHYGDTTGTDFLVDLGDLVKDPDFTAALGEEMGRLDKFATTACQGAAGTTCMFTVDSRWQDLSFTKDRSHELGIGRAKFRVQGTLAVTVGQNGTSSVRGSYSVGIHKNWDFDPEDDFMGVSLAMFAEMPSWGVAQEYVMRGTTSMTYNR
jgi:RHS repeat-associated protein